MYIKNMISNKRSYAARTVALVLFMFCIAFGMAHFNPVMADAKTAVKTTAQKKKKTSAKKGHWKTGKESAGLKVSRGNTIISVHREYSSRDGEKSTANTAIFGSKTGRADTW